MSFPWFTEKLYHLPISKRVLMVTNRTYILITNEIIIAFSFRLENAVDIELVIIGKKILYSFL